MWSITATEGNLTDSGARQSQWGECPTWTNLEPGGVNNILVIGPFNLHLKQSLENVYCKATVHAFTCMISTSVWRGHSNRQVCEQIILKVILGLNTKTWKDALEYFLQFFFKIKFRGPYVWGGGGASIGSREFLSCFLGWGYFITEEKNLMDYIILYMWHFRPNNYTM